jgi:hypothetical protein
VQVITWVHILCSAIYNSICIGLQNNVVLYAFFLFPCLMSGLSHMRESPARGDDKSTQLEFARNGERDPWRILLAGNNDDSREDDEMMGFSLFQ